MKKVQILFLAAEPAGLAPLQLGEEMREIRQSVRAVDFRRILQFDPRWAVRTDDLMDALEETRPQVVHFSGHGKPEGLALVGDDGRPHWVRAEVLEWLFNEFRGDIRVAVLSACYSQLQAKAIAAAVGCAIGTSGRVLNHAAIVFNKRFYRGLALGKTVDAAYTHARLAAELRHFEDADFHIEYGPGVNRAELVLAPPPMFIRVWETIKRRWEWIFTGVLWIAAFAVAMAMGVVAGWALGLSLLPLLITHGLLRLGHSPMVMRAMGPGRAAISAMGLSAAVVVAGATVINRDALQRAKSHYEAQNYAAALPVFERLAHARNAEAMGYLGIMQMLGQGPAKQDSAGIEWLKRGAAHGDARAMYVLGIAYEFGEGVTPDDSLAVRYYRSAQAKGHAEAANKLGEMYRMGIGVDQSYDDALKWYLAAADAGSVDGMINAGLIYELGLAGGIDLAQARKFYERAAAAGSTRAMVHLGALAENQPGGEAEARGWYEQSDSAGDADGTNSLGILYATGRGVRQNLDRAAALFDSAARAGSFDASQNRDLLEDARRSGQPAAGASSPIP